MASGDVLTADTRFDFVCSLLERLPAVERVDAIRRYGARLESLELAALVTDSADDGSSCLLDRDRGSSKAKKRRVQRRVKTVRDNPDLGTKDLSGEQLDVLGGADQRSQGEASKDPNLVDRVKATNPDQGKTIVDKWLKDRANANDAQAEQTANADSGASSEAAPKTSSRQSPSKATNAPSMPCGRRRTSSPKSSISKTAGAISTSTNTLAATGNDSSMPSPSSSATNPTVQLMALVVKIEAAWPPLVGAGDRLQL